VRRVYGHRHPGAGEWRAVVLYPTWATETPAAPAYRTTFTNPWVHRVSLEEALRAPSLKASPGAGLIRLILARPQESAEQARELMHQAGEERTWILDWVETILVRTRRAWVFR
jgi:hypothetical protein